ncbi:MAG: hypothetical protein HRU20_06295 [Pseudomonadales bacterium]|nr:hypothetical protein [Pseudomonadales bacterium]
MTDKEKLNAARKELRAYKNKDDLKEWRAARNAAYKGHTGLKTSKLAKLYNVERT